MNRRRRENTIPGEFQKLGLHRFQGILDCVTTPEEFARTMIAGLDDAERATLRAYLTRIVEPDHSGDALIGLWNATPASYHFLNGEELRQVLTLVRDQLGLGRTRPGWVPLGEGRRHGKRAARHKSS